MVIAGDDAGASGDIAAALRDEPAIEVIAQASRDDVIAVCRVLRPDVVVYTSPMRESAPDVPSVTLSDHVRETWNADGASRGVRAVIARDAAAAQIAAAIGAVDAGLAAAPPSAFTFDSAPERTPRADKLTPREVEVLGELARGSATKAIALRLNISEHTVKFHIASILAKLGVSSRTGAVAQGVRLGLIML